MMGRLRSAWGVLLLLCLGASVGTPLAIALGQTGKGAEKCCRRKKAHVCWKRTPRGIRSQMSGCGGSWAAVSFRAGGSAGLGSGAAGSGAGLQCAFLRVVRAAATGGVFSYLPSLPAAKTITH